MSTGKIAKAQFIIPELHDNRSIEWTVHLAKDLGAYDMIIGRDLLSELKIDILFSEQIVTWDGHDMPFKDIDESKDSHSYHIQETDNLVQAADRLKQILDAKYERADLPKFCADQSHLNYEEQQKLLQLFLKHESLFDGTLGQWAGTQYDIELLPDAKPYHAKAFPIPKVHMNTLKLEVDRLCEIGVLKKVNRSEWACPTFIVPKKDGSVRFISDFRELNKRIRRKPYPIPKIQDMLLKLEGFQYATSLDLNMGYYHIELSPDSKKYCTIVLPFGKYEYQRLPMGLCNSPDIFQEKMSELMEGLEFVRAYIDDLLCVTSKDLDDHLAKLDLVLERIKHAGLKCNINKSFFCKGELEYLGYWITREGIQPVPKKIEAILKIATPTTRKQLRSFIGLVNYYRDMWIRRSHILAPLAELTSKSVKWKWTEVHQKAFDTMKRVLAREVLLAYPNFNETFEIHTDASHTQLGAVIAQKGKPIAFYSRKLNLAQTRYTTTERELLSIVETLKEFRNILLGHKIVVYTDHKNLTFRNFNTERVMRWRLLVEEYGPELRYIKGENNIVADALSRLDMTPDSQFEEEKLRTPAVSFEHMQENLAEVFASTRDEEAQGYPLTFAAISEEQEKDDALMNRYATRPKYKRQIFRWGDDSYNLITRDDKIVVPESLQVEAVKWYHTLLHHCGETRTELTIGQRFYWKGMRETIKQVCSKCAVCQLAKPRKSKLGHLPEKQAETVPWNTVCIDLIGPYQVGKGTNQTTLHAMTMIDPATGWFEIAEIPKQDSFETASLLEATWLNRYPWPQQVVLDHGKEFMGEIKRMLKEDYGIKRKPITTRNPQANAMVERAHQTVHNMIRSKLIRSKKDLPLGWTGVLNAVRFAMNSTVHTTNRATSMQLVFGRDSILPIKFQADWDMIKSRKQTLIHKNNARENARRQEHTYTVGDKVLVLLNPSRKHGEDMTKGPLTVCKVNDNGTVRLRQRTASGAVFQTWNIRNVIPYKA